MLGVAVTDSYMAVNEAGIPMSITIKVPEHLITIVNAAPPPDDPDFNWREVYDPRLQRWLDEHPEVDTCGSWTDLEIIIYPHLTPNADEIATDFLLRFNGVQVP